MVGPGLLLATGSGWMAGTALQTLQAQLGTGLQRLAALGVALLLLAAAVAAGAAGRAGGAAPRWARGPGVARRGQQTALAWLLALAAGVLAGWAATDGRAAARLAQALAPELEGEDLQVVGLISGMPTRRVEGLRFRFEIESARWRGRPLEIGPQVPAAVSLGWYVQAGQGSRANDAVEGDAAAAARWPLDTLPQAGQRWRFTLRLRRPHGSLNPDGFDYELWMFEQGLRATGYVRDAAGAGAPELIGASGLAPIELARQRWRDALLRELGDRPAAGVLAALAVGEQAAIERADWEVFRTTGVAHLVAISGLHVTLLAWLCARLVGWLWRRSRRAMHWLPSPHAARWGGLLAALLYALLAGWGVPAQRTVVMLATATVLRAAGWRWPGSLVLWCTALVVLAFDPWAWLQAGFWLSFVAVALLMNSDRAGLAAAPGGAGERAAWADPQSQSQSQSQAGPAATDDEGAPAPPPGRWRRLWAALLAWLRPALQVGWRSQWVASVGLAPWTLLFFQQLSLVGLLANAWAIPLVTLLITPLALAGLLWAPLWSLGAWLVEAMMGALGAMAAWPGASWSAPVAPWWWQAAGLAGALLLVLPLPWRLRGLGLGLLVPMLWPPLPRPAPGEFELLAADVGQGSAVLLRTRGHALLYDAGARYSAQADAGSRVLVPLLRAQGVPRLDLMVLSHRDSDHIGGAQALLRQPGAWRLSSSLEAGHPLRTRVVHQPCVAGQVWVWDDVRFEVLHPGEREYERADQRLLPSNGLSCVLRVQGRQAAVLLPGDIGHEQERTLVSRHAAGLIDLRADVLLVPHHGSRSSSSDPFLDAVQPRIAVAQLGWRNRYGHPAAEVEARYLARGMEWLRSDRCGAWRWSSAGGADRATGGGHCERQERPRYWHAPAWGDGPELAKSRSSNPSSP